MKSPWTLDENDSIDTSHSLYIIRPDRRQLHNAESGGYRSKLGMFVRDFLQSHTGQVFENEEAYNEYMIRIFGQLGNYINCENGKYQLDCNSILKGRNQSKRYTLDDRYSVKKSKEMFMIIQSYHNPGNDVEVAIRSWNGGPRYSKKGTQRYYERVMSEMK